jgi:hypothetical protein
LELLRFPEYDRKSLCGKEHVRELDLRLVRNALSSGFRMAQFPSQNRGKEGNTPLLYGIGTIL